MSKKPGLGGPQPTREFLERMAACVESIMGRRLGKVGRVSPLVSKEVTTTPTADEHNALRNDIAAVREKLNALIERIED